jgi:RimJ/RimL family protein N-acetyltransferase
VSEQAKLMLLSGDLSQTHITSARLTMRAFTAADAAESFAEANDRVAKFMSWNPPASETEFKTIWQRGISDMKTGKGLHLVIRLTSTNEFIGAAGLDPANAALLETGLWIKESA